MPKNKTSNPVTTIDELAIMVQKGFESMDLRFENMESRLESMGSSTEQLEKSNIGILKRLDRLEKSNRAILAVVSELPLAEAFDRMQTKLLDLDHRVHALERKQ